MMEELDDMDARDIEHYLAELGTELKARGFKKPIRMMLIGGAYMLVLAKAPRTTHDIDVLWLDEEAYTNTVRSLAECVQAITKRLAIRPDWFNFLAQMLMQDEVIVPDGELWKRFGPLHIYVPPAEYILALKITAGRDKDIVDCGILLPETKIRTREQAQQLLDRYITPEGQEKNAEVIEDTLNKLFNAQ